MSEFNNSPLGWALRAAIAAVAGLWGGLTPLMQALVVLMALDIVTGFLAGYVTKELSSEVSFRGMGKKAIILTLVAGAWMLEANGSVPLPLGGAVAGFYIAHEGLSLVENAGRAGVPVPSILQEALAKLKGATDG